MSPCLNEIFHSISQKVSVVLEIIWPIINHINEHINGTMREKKSVRAFSIQNSQHKVRYRSKEKLMVAH